MFSKVHIPVMICDNQYRINFFRICPKILLTVWMGSL